jgi:Fur family peroxide stress response transcriptional regulator
MKKVETMECRLNEFVESCKKVGLKVTHQRIEIFKTLAETREHPDVETIYRRVKHKIPTISLDTVYRTLRTMVKHNLISLLQVTPERMRFDANTEPHYHFICNDTGQVIDLDIDPIAIDIPDEIGQFGTIDSVNIEFRGTLKQA